MFSSDEEENENENNKSLLKIKPQIDQNEN